MLFLFAVTYHEELAKAFNNLAHIAGDIASNEKKMFEQIVEREELMSDLDNIEMSESELKRNAEIIMMSSPNRIKLNTELERLYAKMRG